MDSSGNLDTLRDIRSIMERSSRFISLSGWSGILAGLFALAGAGFAYQRVARYYSNDSILGEQCPSCLKQDLMVIAGVVFVAAFVSAMLLTYYKSKKERIPLWGAAARRLLWNTLLPMVVGGIVIIRMVQLNQYELVAPSTLIFYGLALVNGSKYSLGEVRYLGYGQLLTGIIGLFALQQGLYIWAFGFGVLHIVYGIAMWWKYDRNSGDKVN